MVSSIPVWSDLALGLVRLTHPATETAVAMGLGIIERESASMARLFDQVEHLLERVLETPGRLLFRTRLEPVELARAIGRAMESSSLVGADGLLVPNSYRVELHPADFEPFAPWLNGLQQDLARFVGQRASGR